MTQNTNSPIPKKLTIKKVTFLNEFKLEDFWLREANIIADKYK